MLHLTSKKTLIFCSALLMGVVGLTTPTHAAVNSNYESACEELERTTWDGAPAPMAIICPIVRLLNLFVYSAAAFFVAFIFIAAIKYALAQGDPKALQASQQTLTTALIGFLVVIGVWTILTIIKNIFGLGGNVILDPFGALSQNLAKFLEKLNISD